MPRRRNMGFFGGSEKSPLFSCIGLLFFLLTFGGGWLWAHHESAKGGFHGFAGFAVVAIWSITLPISLLLALIGLIRKEQPIALPITATVLSILPIVAYILLLIFITRSG